MIKDFLYCNVIPAILCKNHQTDKTNNTDTYDLDCLFTDCRYCHHKNETNFLFEFSETMDGLISLFYHVLYTRILNFKSGEIENYIKKNNLNIIMITYLSYGNT